jgi:hypothetical protein
MKPEKNIMVPDSPKRVVVDYADYCNTKKELDSLRRKNAKLLKKLIELRDSEHISITGNDWTEIDLLIKNR